MFKQLIEMFRKPPAVVIAREDLEESQRQFLKHDAAANYHAKIAEYYSGSIRRLGTYIEKA